MGYGGRWFKIGRSVMGGFVLWVMVVGYGGGWVEMVIGKLVVVGGSTGDRVVGESMMANRWWCHLCFDLFLSLFFCFGGCDLVVDSAAVVG